MLPESGATRPATALRSVDFPEPFGPTSATRTPRGTRIETPPRAGLPIPGYDTRRPRVWSAGAPATGSACRPPPLYGTRITPNPIEWLRAAGRAFCRDVACYVSATCSISTDGNGCHRKGGDLPYSVSSSETANGGQENYPRRNRKRRDLPIPGSHHSSRDSAMVEALWFIISMYVPPSPPSSPRASV